MDELDNAFLIKFCRLCLQPVCNFLLQLCVVVKTLRWYFGIQTMSSLSVCDNSSGAWVGEYYHLPVLSLSTSLGSYSHVCCASSPVKGHSWRRSYHDVEEAIKDNKAWLRNTIRMLNSSLVHYWNMLPRHPSPYNPLPAPEQGYLNPTPQATIELWSLELWFVACYVVD
ncbi:hypothetical protein J6590_097869 [Homalodisca vitripennis]|nr:hypothetical protein J6590_097869 [Homalodisca vitripennis]